MENIMTESRFKNKTILVTGAGTGIGRAAALHLAKEGAQLALIGRRLEPLQELAREIKKIGGSAIALSCDITNTKSLSIGLNQIIDLFGDLHGLFANAGILGEFKPLLETDLEDFDSLIDINLKGTFLTIKHCLPLLETGAIVINASWTAQSVMPGTGAYAATKGALLSMMKTLAVEQGQRGIRVNAISPGIILTPMADKALDAEVSRKLADHAALKRNGVPEDISGTVAWLLSEDSAFVTGQEITIDGGYTIGGIRL
jgi:NAD(P)-dependent dehydrogenase (short-subunit alcohol dehydrogenase family)